MGTREVYEEKLRTGNLYHAPTMNPGVGTAHCPRCLCCLDSSSKTGDWPIAPVLHDASAVAGTGLGAILSAIHGFNTGIPFFQKHVKGPKWRPFVVGVPSLLIWVGACAAFGGYTLPRFQHLILTSYYEAFSASHYGISSLTRRIEEERLSTSPHEKL